MNWRKHGTSLIQPIPTNTPILLSNQRLGVSIQSKHDKLIYTLGLGFESSNMLSKTHVLDTLFNRTLKAFDFSPTASLNYSFTTKSRLNLQYRGTTNQPTVDQLQPIVSDPNSLTIRKGNPDLKSSFTNDLSLGYNDVDAKTFANYFVNIQYSNVLRSISNSYFNGPNGETDHHANKRQRLIWCCF